MADVITRLKLDSGEYDSKIKRAAQGLLQMEQECRKVNGTLAILEKDQKQFVQSLGSMQTVSTSVRGKIGELTGAYTELRAQYNRLTADEKKGDFGRALSQSLDQLKGRVNDAKKELADINKELAGGKFGEFGNVIDTIGSKLGVTGNLTEMLTSKTALLTGAVGAGIAVVTKATEAWASYNAELAKQDQITQVTTGLKGEDADRMTDKMRALSDTYNVDFREAVNAANTLMTQFGKTGDEATQLIKDGMRGMIQGDGPKLLSMIQQYAPAFRDAGVSASQLVAVIQNSEGGIFTDQNMNAIVMGIKNIRLMTKATSDALAQLGIDGEKMSKQLSDGSLTIFDALKQVAHQLQTVDSNSKTAGEVMQQVFGRQGTMAGTNLAKAIETLNTNLEETKKQTGELGDALADLQTANEKLNTAIREAFSYDGWDQMAAGIRSKLITALADVISMLGTIRGWFNSIEDDVRKGLGQTVSRNGGAGFGGGGNGGGIRGNNNPSIVPPPRPGGSNKTTTNKPTYAADSIAAQQALVSELTKKWNEASQDMQQGYVAQLVVAEAKLREMKHDAEVMKDLAMGKFSGQGFGSIAEASGAFGLPAGITTKTAPLEARWLSPETLAKANREAQKTPKSKTTEKQEKSAVEVMSQMNSGINQIAGGIEGLGIKLPEELSGILGGINSMLSILQGITILVQGIAAMQEVGTFLGIIPGMARGGIVPHAANGYYVPGNSFSGDNTLIAANAGELILSKSAQGNLASMLTGGWLSGLHLELIARGETMRVVLNNNGKRTGRGELLTTNRR